jgi:hypothetical protein
VWRPDASAAPADGGVGQRSVRGRQLRLSLWCCVPEPDTLDMIRDGYGMGSGPAAADAQC